MWHYIDDVLVETLLFGEEYALATVDTASKAAHGRQLSDSVDSDEANATKTASSVHHTNCDPNHLDENVTLHFVCAFVTD